MYHIISNAYVCIYIDFVSYFKKYNFQVYATKTAVQNPTFSFLKLNDLLMSFVRISFLSLHSAGTVYTPKDGLLWNISRAQLQISDMFIGQISEHLLKTHFKMEPLCVTLHRHLSKMHPLHQILKYHCRGLLPVNKNGVKVLFRTDETLKSLFGYGAEGATQLVNEEFLKMTWNDTDLELNLKVDAFDFILLYPRLK